jgi:hypothetical protein
MCLSFINLQSLNFDLDGFQIAAIDIDQSEHPRSIANREDRTLRPSTLKGGFSNS